MVHHRAQTKTQSRKSIATYNRWKLSPVIPNGLSQLHLIAVGGLRMMPVAKCLPGMPKVSLISSTKRETDQKQKLLAGQGMMHSCLRRLSQEDDVFQVSLGYRIRHCKNKQITAKLTMGWGDGSVSEGLSGQTQGPELGFPGPVKSL